MGRFGNGEAVTYGPIPDVIDTIGTYDKAFVVTLYYACEFGRSTFGPKTIYAKSVSEAVEAYAFVNLGPDAEFNAVIVNKETRSEHYFTTDRRNSS